MADRHSREILHQPYVGKQLQRGIHALVGAVRPTLGPVPRMVAVAASSGARTPELLDDGGLIARRMLQLPDRDEDVGAMLLRDVLLRVHDLAGDGVATTSVIFQSIFDDGLRALAAGCNAMRLRAELQEGLGMVLASLDEASLVVGQAVGLRDVAHTVCPDADLAGHIAEIFEVIGEYGQVAFRSGQAGHLAHEIIEGSYWNASLHSRAMLADQGLRRVELQRPVVFLSDLEIDQAEDLAPVLRFAKESGAGSLVVIARRLSEPCVGFLAANSGPDFPVLSVRTPEGARGQYLESLADLAALTGARAFHAASGARAGRVGPDDLGHCRRAWADQTHFGIIGPAGDPRRWREHVRSLRQAERSSDEPALRQRLIERIARLTGATALLWVSGSTTPRIDQRKALAQRTALALRSTLRDGALPGAGVALLASRGQLAERLECADNDDRRAAYRMLMRAVEAPTRALVSNAGYDPAKVFLALESGSPANGWDARTGQVVDVVQSGIVDPAAVVRMAVRAGVEGAAQALTIDTLVHPGKSELVIRK